MPMLTVVQSAGRAHFNIKGASFLGSRQRGLLSGRNFKTEAQANEGKARVSNQQERVMPFCGKRCKGVQPEPNYL
jgi:hypothetical protein